MYDAAPVFYQGRAAGTSFCDSDCVHVNSVLYARGLSSSKYPACSLEPRQPGASLRAVPSIGQRKAGLFVALCTQHQRAISAGQPVGDPLGDDDQLPLLHRELPEFGIQDQIAVVAKQ